MLYYKLIKRQFMSFSGRDFSFLGQKLSYRIGFQIHLKYRFHAHLFIIDHFIWVFIETNLIHFLICESSYKSGCFYIQWSPYNKINFGRQKCDTIDQITNSINQQFLWTIWPQISDVNIWNQVVPLFMMMKQRALYKHDICN